MMNKKNYCDIREYWMIIGNNKNDIQNIIFIIIKNR